ncbi:MAG TPA: hypothetical protein DEA08_39305 [Planctomycetes bacterium]|nr:hypothetical protein [Planctomycetota bacterium]
MERTEALLAAVDAVRAKLDEQRPYTPEQRERVLRWFLPRFIYCSSALGKNDPVTGRETVLFLESQTVSGGHHIDDFLSIERHKRALEVAEQRAEEGGELDRDFLQLLHRKLVEGSRRLAELEERPGLWRQTEAPPMRRRGHEIPSVPSDQIEGLIDQLMSSLKRQRAQGEHPIFSVAYLCFHLYLIRPFATHNGEVSRLAMTTLLLHAGYPGLVLAPDTVSDFLDALVAVHRSVPVPERVPCSPRYELAFLVEFLCSALTRTGERMIDLSAGRKLTTATFSRRALAAQEEQLTQFLHTKSLSWRVRATTEIRAMHERCLAKVEPMTHEGPLYSLSLERAEVLTSHAASAPLRAILPAGEAGVVGEIQLGIRPNTTMRGLEYPDPEQLLLGVASTQYGMHVILVVASDSSQRPVVRTGPLRNNEWPDSTLDTIVAKAIDKRRRTYEYELNLKNSSRSQRFKLKKLRDEHEEAGGVEAPPPSPKQSLPSAADKASKEGSGPKARDKRLDGLSPTEPPLSF